MAQKRKCILMDVDGVLLDLIPNVSSYVFEKYGATITENMVTAWDWDYCLGVPLTRNDEFWKYVWSKPATPYTWSIEFVKLLRAMGFAVIAVSNRSTPEARAAAERDFPQFNFDYFVLVKDSREKVHYAHEIFATHSLEDSPKNAVMLGEGKTDMKSFLITRPWNSQAISLTKAFTRIPRRASRSDEYKIFLEHMLEFLVDGKDEA